VIEKLWLCPVSRMAGNGAEAWRLTQAKIWNRLIVTDSAPTRIVAGSSLMGRLSRIFIDGLEVADLEEGRVDLLDLQACAEKLGLLGCVNKR